MSNITSAGVSRRFQSLFEASGQAINQAPAVAAILTEILSPALEDGETLPGVEQLQRIIGRRIASLNAELEEADHQRKHFKSLDRHRREVIERATAKLRSALVDVRYILDRTLTKTEAKAFFEGRSNLTRLKSPVIERVSARLVSLLADPKFGWDQLSDAGYRATAEASRLRLQAALTEFEQTQEENLSERDALLLAQGGFDRDYEEKGVRLRGLVRLLRGLYLSVNFEREAAALVWRRRKTAQDEEEAPGPDPAPGGGGPVPSARAAGVPAIPVPARILPRKGAYAPRRRRRALRVPETRQGDAAMGAPAVLD